MEDVVTCMHARTQVTFSGLVDGVSPGGVLVRFAHEGTVITRDTTIKIQPLTPATNYRFIVSAITERGRGSEVSIEAHTARADTDFGKLCFVAVTWLCDLFSPRRKVCVLSNAFWSCAKLH